MAQIRIVLPSINGEIEAGITVGVDASLPDDKKLPILLVGGVPAQLAVIKQNCLSWGLNKFTDNTAKALFLNGISGLLDTGLICTTPSTDGGTPDGDWYKTLTEFPLDEAGKTALTSTITLEAVKKAVTVAIATKANFWLMNHHTGQGQVAGYVKKVLDVFYPNAVTDQVVSAAHNLGHFTSTLFILNMAGIAGVRGAASYVKVEGASIRLSDDSKLRFQSMPAGTHRLAVAYEAAKRLIRSVYAPFCPGVEDFSALPGLRDTVMRSPVTYHIGASYLTGQARADYQDTDMNSYLGRLGTFINTLYKQSTLAKSPHMVPAKVESYDDYDADFKANLGRIQTVQTHARGRVLEEHLGAMAVASPDVLDEIRQAYFPGRGQAAGVAR